MKWNNAKEVKKYHNKYYHKKLKQKNEILKKLEEIDKVLKKIVGRFK